jgi:hypothetical protein
MNIFSIEGIALIGAEAKCTNSNIWIEETGAINLIIYIDIGFFDIVLGSQSVIVGDAICLKLDTS